MTSKRGNGFAICGPPTAADLSIEVRQHDVVVSQPETGRCVTYRRDPSSPMLEALCEMRSDPDAETLQFLSEAWKAAFAKAKAH